MTGVPLVAFVVLAAGGSRRLGTAKQLVPCRGRTLLRHAVEVAVEAADAAARGSGTPGEAHSGPMAGPVAEARARGPVVVVLGAEAARMRAEIEGLPAQVAVNARWAEGLAGSVRLGLETARRLAGPEGDEGRRVPTGNAGPRAVPAHGLDAVLFLTCDQPHVTARLLAEMIHGYRAGAPLVACAYAGTLGIPALFGRAYFEELAALEGDAGAKRVIERHRDVLATVPFEGGDVDVDEPGDWGQRKVRSGP